MIAVAFLSSVYVYVLSYPMPNPAPHVEIVGTVERRSMIDTTGLGNFEEYCDIVLTHRGGESLPLDSKISVVKGNTTEHITVKDYLDSKSKEDGRWGIGERLVYPANDITLLRIEAIVIDTVSDSVIFMGTMQKETMVATLGTFNVQHNGSTLCMDYDFKEYETGRLRFAYKNQSEENWAYTPWIPRSGTDFYHRRVNELSCETTYLYKGQLKYDGTVVTGGTQSFTTTLL